MEPCGAGVDLRGVFFPGEKVKTLKQQMATLEGLRRKISLVQVIGQRIDLKKTASALGTYKGLCPFHDDKTPSLLVHRKKQIFHCFGCGVGGDLFGWTMRYHRLTFPEAVAWVRRQSR